MFRRINIFLCFLLFIAVDLAIAQNNFEIFTPTFIPSDGNFEISIITSNKYPEADKLELYLAPDISLVLTKAVLLFQNQIIRLPIKTDFHETFNENIRYISIDLSDKTKISENDFFQIIVSLKSSSSEKNELELYGEFKNDNKVLGNLINSELSDIESSDNIYNIHFDYYQKYPIAGKAFSLAQDYYLDVPLAYNFEALLAVEFWMKISNPVSAFLEIINRESFKSEYNLSVNENQMLVISSATNQLSQVNSFFLSKDTWYHFKILFDKDNSEIIFFCDNNELSRFNILSVIDYRNLVLHFQNEQINSEYFLDQFRIVKLSENNTAIERNKNYQEYTDTSSSVALQINFSESGLTNLLNKKSVFYEKKKLVKSDAPIFPRSPQINVNLSDTYYEIEWHGGNYKYAFEYIVEKATGDNDFNEIGSVTADNSLKKVYSLISDRNKQTEVIFFRVKQLNKDGTIVYSDVIKVGQGMIDDIIIGQNFPNPFNPTTLIEFELTQDSDVEVKVYNLAGREIAILHEGFLSKGNHHFTFDGEGYPSGVYIYQITTPISSQTRKMILAK